MKTFTKYEAQVAQEALAQSHDAKLLQTMFNNRGLQCVIVIPDMCNANTMIVAALAADVDKIPSEWKHYKLTVKQREFSWD